MNAYTPAQAAAHAFVTGCVNRGITVSNAAVPAECQLGAVKELWADVAKAATAAQEPSLELAMLRADLADAEALLARWPRCPAGCSCRVGIPEDADANECGCDGPCNGDDASGPTSQLHEGDWDDAVSEATS